MNLASIFELLNSRAQATAVVDANGDQLTTFPVTGTVDVGNTVDVNVTNVSVPVSFAAPANAALTSVNSSTSSVTLLTANANRRKFIIVNAGTKILYIAFAATATTSAYTVALAANGVYESEVGDYSGIVTGVWSAVNGAAKITEITV